LKRISTITVLVLALLFVIGNLGITGNAEKIASADFQPVLESDAPALNASLSTLSESALEKAPNLDTGQALPGWFNLSNDSYRASEYLYLDDTDNVSSEETQANLTALPAWFSQSASVINATSPDPSSENKNPVTHLSSREKSEDILPTRFNASVDSNSSPTSSPASSVSMGSVLPSSPQSSGIESIASTSVEVILPDAIRHGEVVTFTIVAINGPSIASNVVLTSTMPTGFTPAIQSKDFGEVAANEIITFTAAYAVAPDAVSGTNIVTLSQSGESDIVINTAFSVNPSIPASSIVVSGPSEVNNCETVTYTISFTATDTFTDTAGVAMTVTVPSGFEPSIRTYDIGVVQAGETITNAAVFTSACDSSSGEVTAYVSQQGYEGSVSSYKSFIVNPGAISLTKTPSIITASAGEIVTWTISVTTTFDTVP